jgi:hypothetical protein
MWQFQDIRARAIKALDSLTLSMDPVDKIVMARKFDVSQWLVTSLHALIQREKPLDLSEGNRLGMEWVLKVAEVRESSSTVEHPACKYCGYLPGYYKCSSCNGLTKGGSIGRARFDDDDKIRKIFGLE